MFYISVTLPIFTPDFFKSGNMVIGFRIRLIIINDKKLGFDCKISFIGIEWQNPSSIAR